MNPEAHNNDDPQYEPPALPTILERVKAFQEFLSTLQHDPYTGYLHEPPREADDDA